MSSHIKSVNHVFFVALPWHPVNITTNLIILLIHKPSCISQTYYNLAFIENSVHIWLQNSFTNMLCGLSAAIATAGSKFTFTGRPYTLKNWVGSSFYKMKRNLLLHSIVWNTCIYFNFQISYFKVSISMYCKQNFIYNDFISRFTGNNWCGAINFFI